MKPKVCFPKATFSWQIFTCNRWKE